MSRPALGRLAVALLVAAGIAAAIVWRDHLDTAALQSLVNRFGFWAPAVFILLYALATVLFLPGSLFTLAGGALFGPVWGTVWNLTGATLGATLAFLVARYLATDWARRRAGGTVRRLCDGVAAEGWRFVAFVRLVPLFPFNLLNYALGLTGIRLSHYVFASIVCMAPACVAYTYLGHAGREALAGGEAAVRDGLLALGAVALVAFLPRLARRLRRGPEAGGS